MGKKEAKTNGAKKGREEGRKGVWKEGIMKERKQGKDEGKTEIRCLGDV